MASNLNRNLLQDLLPTGVRQDELVEVLSRSFQTSSHDTDTRDVFFPGVEPYELKVEFDSHGDVKGIYALPGLEQAKLNSIRQAIHEELTAPSGIAIGGRVFFSLHPVTGWWRYRDKFQILPVPAQAPKPGVLYAKHPFLIEFSYQKTGKASHLIGALRRDREATQVGMLLNGLLSDPITWIPSKCVGTSNDSWVLLPEQPNGELKVAYCQHYYTYSGERGLSDVFSATEDIPPISEVSPEAYYSSKGVSAGEPLSLPSDLCDVFDAFYALDFSSRQRVLNACYWLSQVNETTSFSLALGAAVQALEGMMPNPKGGPQCPACKRAQGPSRTALFKTFLDVFAPVGRQGVGERSELYRVRSDLTHGFRPPFIVDFGPHAFGLNPADIDQREEVGRAMTVARACIRNWIHCEPFVHDRVAVAAYYLWEKAKFVHGEDKMHWHQAIADLRGLRFLNK